MSGDQGSIPDAEAKLCQSVAFFYNQHIIDLATLQQASHAASQNGTTAAEELFAAGTLTEEQYAKALADHAGCTYLEADDVKSVMSRGSAPAVQLQPKGLRWCRLQDDHVIPVSLADPHMTARFIAHVKATHIDSIGVMAHSQFKQALLKQDAKAICETEAEKLYHDQPLFSARFGANFNQGVVLSVFIFALIFAFLTGPSLSALTLHIVLSVFFAGCVIVRLLATMQPLAKPAQVQKSPNAEKPVYSVLVTLLDEAEIVPGLIRHLSALQWPASKLEIKLICEEDDAETIAAIERLQPDRRFEIIKVPDIGPRTKPKALTYALPFTIGRLITLYDAEDRPHPMQLEEAWQKFQESDNQLACLQAPLMIANAKRNVLTALFYIEYAGLFRKLLPWLSKLDCPLPLGGTSNHFRGLM